MQYYDNQMNALMSMFLGGWWPHISGTAYCAVAFCGVRQVCPTIAPTAHKPLESE